MSSELELLLQRPLAEPADDGFSRRVITRIAQDRNRTAKVRALIELGLVATVLALAPFTSIGQMMEKLAADFIASPLVSSAAAATAVAFIALRVIGEFTDSRQP